MLKKTVTLLLAGSIVFGGMTQSGTIQANADGNGLVMDKEKLILKQIDEQSVQKETQTFKLPVLTEEENFEKDEEPESKITHMLREELELNKDKETTFDVEVLVHFDYTDEEFEQKYKELFGNSLELTKRKISSYLIENINYEQLVKLEMLKEVLVIASINNYIVPDKAAEGGEEIGINLNSSTDMIGVKKARKDFKVTGDLDGNENVYSTKDVVIAIVDTGIDANHVDLDGGKVIAWYDAVNGKTKPYDDRGHGTHVASIAAGTGEGDPGVQEGVAPGAALVGVKTLPGAGQTGDPRDTLKGLEWILANLDRYSIDVVNMSIGTTASYESRKEVINTINKIKARGVPVFVAAGNEGNDEPYYDTLSTYAKYTSTSVGNIKDPYEGGWGLAETSSRGTDENVSYNKGPYVVLPGHNVRAAAANTGKEYVTLSGTSMATPMVSGVFALMYDAAYSRGVSSSINFTVTDMGEEGFDKNYGNGRVLAYESIKDAAQESSGSFDTHRTYIRVPNGSVQKGNVDLYAVRVNSSAADLNATLLVLNEKAENLDLVIWAPGSNPYQGDPSSYWIRRNDGPPQEFFSLSNPPRGTYYIGVYGVEDSANYSLEITGHELTVN
ncbi:S8 family serine peptidase [Paenibacillus faecis]|uniref:S8 family serine peptidase n=1 Tax=Paenibacillus faecis TaxID=862114 RepID=A0A5D0CKY2_9BACL|nr:S8 family serine peptidase [Paenibacillus faecis]TYA10508.1 S8 family serine peptidase [Paenibacillus faecis]